MQYPTGPAAWSLSRAISKAAWSIIPTKKYLSWSEDDSGEVQGSLRRDILNDESKESEAAESEAAESDDSDSDLTEADPDHIRELCLAF